MTLKPANDPTVDYRHLVQRGYDRCSAVYEASRQKETEPELELLTGKLSDGAKVLDVGCGAGVPTARALAQRFEVTGVDASREMIRRANRNVPTGAFIHGDILSVDLPSAHFDAAVAFYSIFHLPREEHDALFHRIHRWLKAEGYFLATVSEQSEAPYTEEDFFGVTMYWSNYGLGEYEAMLDAVGFHILATGSIGHGYQKTHDTPEERHPFIFAQKGRCG